jgi:hypothetical protein
MRFSPLAIVALIGGASAAPNPLKHGEQEALADKALTNIGEHVAANGYANSKCTLKNAAVRKEWSEECQRWWSSGTDVMQVCSY